MSSVLIVFLVLHIIFGTGGIVLMTAYLLLISKKNIEIKWLKVSSILAFLAFLASWIFGGFYYTSYYGKAVKPVILKGHFAWVHEILMETKEHVFLFIPFLSLVIVAVTLAASGDLISDSKVKKALASLAFVVVGIALFILILGIFVSGAVGKT